MKRAVLTCLFVLCAGVCPAPAHPQQDTTARVTGTVRSSINGLPISGVMIAVPSVRTFDVSDSTGSFTLAGLPPGRQTVRILYDDSLSYQQELNLKRGKTVTLSVLLDVAAVELAPIVVEAQSLRAERSLAGFYDRKQLGFGRFYTLVDLDRLGDLSLRGLLGHAGVVVRCRLRSCVPVLMNGARACVMPLFLDGLRVSPDYLEILHVKELAGVEVYTHGVDVPVKFRWDVDGGCGAILVWSRY